MRSVFKGAPPGSTFSQSERPDAGPHEIKPGSKSCGAPAYDECFIMFDQSKLLIK